METLRVLQIKLHKERRTFDAMQPKIAALSSSWLREPMPERRDAMRIEAKALAKELRTLGNRIELIVRRMAIREKYS